MNRPLSLNRWIYVEGNPVNLKDPTGKFPEWCKSFNGRFQYEDCVRRFYSLRAGYRDTLPLDKQEGYPGCWKGPVSYRAPGYLEGASVNFSFIIGATFAAEIVYDFATMEKQKFNSKQIGISTEIGVSGIEYQGVVFNFTNTDTLIGEYPGYFIYGSVGAGTGFPGVMQLGTGVTGFKSLSNEVWGVSQYYSIGWSPIPSPISISAEGGFGYATPGEKFNSYILRLTTIRITPQRQLEMPTDKESETTRLFWRRRANDRNRCPSEATDERTNQRQDAATSGGQSQPAQS